MDPIVNAGGIKIPPTLSPTMPGTIRNALHSLDASLWNLPTHTLGEEKVLSFLQKETLKDLLTYRCIQKLAPGEAFAWLHAFPVEKSNQAQRFIGHPKAQVLQYATIN